MVLLDIDSTILPEIMVRPGNGCKFAPTTWAVLPGHQGVTQLLSPSCHTWNSWLITMHLTGEPVLNLCQRMNSVESCSTAWARCCLGRTGILGPNIWHGQPCLCSLICTCLTSSPSRQVVGHRNCGGALSFTEAWSSLFRPVTLTYFQTDPIFSNTKGYTQLAFNTIQSV